MEALNKLKHTLKTADTRELFIYAGSFIAALSIVLSFAFYFHLKRVNYYTQQLSTLDKQRKEARNLLSRYKLVNQRQTEVEDILNQDPSFRIEPIYANLIQKLGLTFNQPEAPTSDNGETVKGKTERILKSRLITMSMKQLTDLLSAIADIPQLYPQALEITKIPNARAVNVDLTIATLQPTSPST
ncbi:hypothetical protein H0X48_06735 [Candidatus Dependentiae bacterium]|nr:hypothetical protein [Candidatus Dependentiae bacterium]